MEHLSAKEFDGNLEYQKELPEIIQEVVADLEQVFVESIDVSGIFNNTELIITQDQSCDKPFHAQVDRFCSKTKIYFSEPDYEQLITATFPMHPLTDRDMAKLYVGMGMALGILSDQFYPHEEVKITRMFEIMSETGPLDQAVRCGEDIGEQEMQDVLLSIIQSSEQRVRNINSLRLAVGCLFLGEQRNGRLDFVDKQKHDYQLALKESLMGREKYIDAVMEMGKDRHRAESAFAERISDLELALCYPMTEREIRTLTEICTQQYPPRTSDLSNQEALMVLEEVKESKGYSHIDQSEI